MNQPHHRRDFVRALALGATVTTLPARADEPRKEDTKPETPKSETDARMELILARFGKQLDGDARRIVRAELEAIVHRAEMLKKFPLTNGDGPFPVFTPYRAPIV